MGFWIFMLLTALLIPLTLICFGARFVSKPPDRINAVYGYRTRRSMKNADTWRFAISADCGSSSAGCCCPCR